MRQWCARFGKLAPPAAVALIAGALLAGLEPASANPDWTKKERKQCAYCHVGAWDSKKYTEAGQYYKDHEYSFKGYVPKAGTDTGKSAKKSGDNH